MQTVIPLIRQSINQDPSEIIKIITGASLSSFEMSIVVYSMILSYRSRNDPDNKKDAVHVLKNVDIDNSQALTELIISGMFDDIFVEEGENAFVLDVLLRAFSGLDVESLSRSVCGLGDDVEGIIRNRGDV